MRHNRDGFTLIELFVFISLVGVLLLLLLPAVANSHEAARRTQCQDNLHKIGLAHQKHEFVQGHLPVGGWSSTWVGDPDRGFGKRQPGGWLFNILPYIENQATYDLAKSKGDLAKGEGKTEKRRLLAKMCSTPLEGFNCPDRRGPGPHKNNPDDGTFNAFNSKDTPQGKVHSDYAMNAGSVIDDVVYTDTVTKTMEEWDDSNYSGNPDFNQGAPAENEYNELDIEWSNGVVFPQIPVHYNQITDGLRNTFLVGEKSLSRNMYENGTSLGDRTSMYEGFGYGTVRNAFRGGMATEPRPDALADRYLAFGSPHRNGVNMVFCDGSLRVINYNINQVVYAKMAMRNDEDYPDKIIADPPPK